MKKVIAFAAGGLLVLGAGAFFYLQWTPLGIFGGVDSKNPAGMAEHYNEAARSGEIHLPTPDGEQPPVRSKQSENHKTAPKYGAEQTLIRTKQPEAVLQYAKQKDLAVKEVSETKTNQTIITLGAAPGSSEVRNLAESTPAKASANYRYHALGHKPPNDPKFGDQWNLRKIKAPKGWHTTTGSTDTVIAIIDSGVLFEQTVGDPAQTFTQPDFPLSKRWENPGEAGAKASNGKDDDNNGYVDDWQGWDFMGGWSGDAGCPNYHAGKDAKTYYGQDNGPNPYSCDSPDHPRKLNKYHYNRTCTAFESACYVGHGTMAGSVAAATANNAKLMAGVDQQAKIMNLRVLDGAMASRLRTALPKRSATPPWRAQMLLV